jgi:thiol-disulfide isomerase/thioredoxin
MYEENSMRSRILASVKAAVAWALASPTVATLAIVLLASGIVYLASHIEAPSAQAAARQAKLIDAPDLIGGADWFNTDKPIRLADLRGRIVLLDFWTLCCINCIHTLPDLAAIEARYPGVVVVIGIHTPKFDNEKSSRRSCVTRSSIRSSATPIARSGRLTAPTIGPRSC